MKTSKLMIAFASIAVMGTILTVHYSNGQSLKQSFQQPTSSQSQTGSSDDYCFDRATNSIHRRYSLVTKSSNTNHS